VTRCVPPQPRNRTPQSLAGLGRLFRGSAHVASAGAAVLTSRITNPPQPPPRPAGNRSRLIPDKASHIMGLHCHIQCTRSKHPSAHSAGTTMREPTDLVFRVFSHTSRRSELSRITGFSARLALHRHRQTRHVPTRRLRYHERRGQAGSICGGHLELASTISTNA